MNETKNNPARILRYVSLGFILTAAVFSVLNDGSYAFWRRTLVQTLVFYAFFFHILERLVSGKTLIPKHRLNRPLFALLCLVVISACFARDVSIAANTVIQVLAFVCGFYIFLSIAKNRREQVWLVITAAAITLGLSIYGLLIHFEIYLFPTWKYVHLFQRGMVCATFANHAHLAGFLEMGILFYLGLFYPGQKTRPALIFMVFLLLIMVTTLILTLSRGGWVAAGFGMIFIFVTSGLNRPYKKSPGKKIFAALALVLLCLVMLGSPAIVKRGMTMATHQNDLIPGRKIIWKGAVDMICQFPLTGVGPGNYATARTVFQPPGVNFPYADAHNDYLQFVAETGVFAIPVMAWLVVTFFSQGFKKLNHPSRQTRWITTCAMAGVVAILVHSTVDYNLQFPSNALFFTALAAQIT